MLFLYPVNLLLAITLTSVRGPLAGRTKGTCPLGETDLIGWRQGGRVLLEKMIGAVRRSGVLPGFVITPIHHWSVGSWRGDSGHQNVGIVTGNLGYQGMWIMVRRPGLQTVGIMTGDNGYQSMGIMVGGPGLQTPRIDWRSRIPEYGDHGRRSRTVDCRDHDRRSRIPEYGDHGRRSRTVDCRDHDRRSRIPEYGIMAGGPGLQTVGIMTGDLGYQSMGIMVGGPGL